MTAPVPESYKTLLAEGKKIFVEATSVPTSSLIAEKVVADNVPCYSMNVPGTSLRRFIGRGIIHGKSFEDAVDALWNHERRNIWDPTIKELVPVTVFAQEGNTTYVTARMLLMPIPLISQRDFYSAMFLEVTNDRAFAGAVSIVDDELCPVDKNYVRGDILKGSGWSLSKTNVEGEFELVYVIHTDIKGWIPQVVVNTAVCDTISEYFVGVRKELKK